ncbi:hypothetical protein J7K42_00330 [bacterium]|nr:hypothetical protein [bacterium]
MLEFTAKIILIGSILGLAFMILRKIPVLRELPTFEMKPSEKERIFISPAIGKKIKRIKVGLWQKISQRLKNFKKEKNFKESEPHFSEDYWEKIRRG